MFTNFNIWQVVKIGGPVMYFLVLCSILSIAVIIERIIFYQQRSRVSRANFMKYIRDALTKGDIKKALTICQEAQAPFASVIAAGLNAVHLDDRETTETLEREIIIETTNLERRTAIVGTIGSTAVYIGLLGTVWGIIESFRDIAQMGSGGINIVIHGISEALVCTAAGLFVAIPAVIAYNYFVKKISSFVTDMELCASEATGLIKEYRRSHEKKA